MIEIDVPKPSILSTQEVGKPIERKVPYFTITFTSEHLLEPQDIPPLVFGMRNSKFICVPIEMDSTDTYYAAFGFFDTSVTEFMRAVVIQERVNKDYATIVMISLHAPWNPKDVPSAEVYKKDLERYGDLIKHPITIDQSTGLQKLEEELVLCKTRAEILAPFWDLVYQFEYFQKTRNIRRIETSLRNLSEASLQAISKQRFLELYGKKLPHAKKHHPTNLEIWMMFFCMG